MDQGARPLNSIARDLKFDVLIEFDGRVNRLEFDYSSTSLTQLEMGKWIAKPRPGYFPIPAVCSDLNKCKAFENNENNENNYFCPRIWVDQEFLLQPDKWSPYWARTQNEAGAYIISNEHINGVKYVYKTTGKILSDQNQVLHEAVWAD